MTTPLVNRNPGQHAGDEIPRLELLWTQHDATDATACMTPGGPIRRRDFFSRVDSLACDLRAGPQACLLAAEDTFGFSVGFCAALRAGRDILMPPNMQPETLDAAMFREALRLDDAFIARHRPAAEAAPAPLDPDQRITLFTSGSSGEPKRIEKRLRQLSAETELLESTFGELLGAASIVATVPHIHIYGVLFRVLWPLAAGRAFCSEPILGSSLGNMRGGVLVSSPAFLARIEVERLAEAGPKAIFSSGGRLPEERARELAIAAACPVIEVYGSTETGGIAWRRWEGRKKAGRWTPFAGVELRVDEPLARLHVRSAATDRRWIDTGDTAKLHENNLLQLNGRADGVIKLEDKRVSLTALADWLQAHSWTSEARIVELPGRRGQLGAVLCMTADGKAAVARESRSTITRNLRQHMLQRFEAVVVPRKWRFVEAFPVNAMGKTTQAALTALFEMREEK